MSQIKRKNLLPLLAVLSLLFASCDGGSQGPEMGKAAPDFTLSSLSGEQYRLSDLKGKVVFVNLWATWCPPCREEMPSMVRLYNRFKRQGLEILAVSEDNDMDDLAEFVRKYHVTFPVLPDRDKNVYRLYRATAVPETHLINKRGVLVNSVIGPFNWTAPEVVRVVATLLAE